MTAQEFLAAYTKLKFSVPRVALTNTHSQNSEYSQYAIANKNCYMIFGSDYNEDSFYGYWIYTNKDAVDSAYLYDSQICYECADVRRSYNMSYCQDCTDCRELCFNCSDCLGCIGLKNKRFHILNEEYSEEEYKKIAPKIKQALRDAGWYGGKLPEVFAEG